MAIDIHSQTFAQACGIAVTGAVSAAAIMLAAFWFALSIDTPTGALIAGAAGLQAVIIFPVLLMLKLRGAEIDRLNRRLDHLTHRDPATNAMNASAFVRAVGQYAERRKRISTDNGGVLISAIVGSYDELSRRYGPDWAETVLKSLTAIIQSSVRSGDLVARLSVNELGIFLPGAAAEHATDVAHRIRMRVSASAIASDGTDIPVSLKLGGTYFDGGAEFNRVRQMASELAADAGDEDAISIAHF